jgi:hypothetical protein
MKNDLNTSNYDKFIDIYNKQGRQAAQGYVADECSINYGTFLGKLHRETSYTFNRGKKRFEEKAADAQFMSLDDLCTTKTSIENVRPVSTVLVNNGGFDELVLDLMRDRLTEMHRFIRFDRCTKQIVVNSRMIKDSGYMLSVI